MGCLCLASGLLFSLSGSLEARATGGATAQPLSVTCASSAEGLDRRCGTRTESPGLRAPADRRSPRERSGSGVTQEGETS